MALIINDTRHKCHSALMTFNIHDTQHSSIECYYAEYRYAECSYAESRFAECRGTLKIAGRESVAVLMFVCAKNF
jgi:hypothetical protein